MACKTVTGGVKGKFMSTANIFILENARTGRAARACKRIAALVQARERGANVAQPANASADAPASLFASWWNAPVIQPERGEMEAKLYPNLHAAMRGESYR